MAELKFLYSLYFTSGLSEDMVWSMLKQLKRPYYYSYDCIYWDFSKARWKYFKPMPQVERLHNPYADNKDYPAEQANDYHDQERYYAKPEVYLVETGNTLNHSFTLRNIGVTDYNVVLKPGDQVTFQPK